MATCSLHTENLGKRYHLGAGKRFRYRSLRESITEAAAFWGQRPPERDLWALRDVTLQVCAGEALGIIGRNGAGKSTLLKVLSRVTEPTAGRARVFGRVGSLLEVGMGFHPELSGRDNIYLNGAVLGMKRREIARKFDEIVQFAELEDFLDTAVKHYSSGMYLRLAFAVAAHLDTEIMLIDEVLAVGDAAFQRKVLGKMQDVARGGRTVLFVSHNLAAISQLCTRAIWLHDGSIRADGVPEQVIHDYLTHTTRHEFERRWPAAQAPGDERVRLRMVRCVQQSSARGIIDINQACGIEIEFDLLRDADDLRTGVNLYNEQGICLFDSTDWRPNRLVAGSYRKRLELPAQLLAEGMISAFIHIGFFAPHVESVLVPDAIMFEAVDSDHPLAVRGDYKGAWPGVLRPRLAWSEAERTQAESAGS